MGDPGVGTRVRMKGTSRTGMIQEVLGMPGRTIYYVVQDITPEDVVTVTGEPAAEFGTYCTDDGFDVLPS